VHWWTEVERLQLFRSWDHDCKTSGLCKIMVWSPCMNCLAEHSITMDKGEVPVWIWYMKREILKAKGHRWETSAVVAVFAWCFLRVKDLLLGELKCVELRIRVVSSMRRTERAEMQNLVKERDDGIEWKYKEKFHWGKVTLRVDV